MSDIPPERRYKIAEDIVATFVHIFGHDAVGDRSQWVLRNAVRAVMDDGGTLLSVPKFLTNKRYRRKVLKAVLDDQVRAVWEEVFANYTSGKEDDVISPILNKLDALLVPPLRNIIGQPKATIDLRMMMDEGRILIVSLQKGMIGELPAKFLGALIVAHIANTAFSRADILADGNVPRPFYLYADEFHNFVSGDFETILAETRKYGLFFRLANQYAQQIDHRLHEGILTNCDTKVAFRCSPENAEAIAPIFGLHKAVLVNDHEGTPYCAEWGIHDARTLTETPRYHAWVRCISNGTMLPPVLLRMTPPTPPANSISKSIVKDSRSRFGRDRSDVQNSISQFMRSHGNPKRTKNHLLWST